MRCTLVIMSLLVLAGCAGAEKGSDVGIGFDALNTTSKDDKENDAWFNSFYGKNHCHGQWAGTCTAGASDEGGGGGGDM